MKSKKFKIIITILGLIILLIVIFLAIITIFEYRPKEIENVKVIPGETSKESSSFQNNEFTVMTWNIGYGCLGDNADFFMDGGTKVKTADAKRLEQNIKGIAGVVESIDPDIAFFQEADINSGRSEYRDEHKDIRDMLPGYSTAFAYNYNALFVPYPLPPIGHVESGIVTASSLPIESAKRHSLVSPFKWPVSTVNLKRCMLVSRISLEGNAGQLVLVNFHLEAFDNGEGKKAQTAQVKSFLEKEVAAGNYVIAGGDFNQTFTNIDTAAYPFVEGCWQPGTLDPKDFEENFYTLMDNRIPSCRSLKAPYAGTDPSQIQFYVIDGFIISKNLEILDYQTIDAGFKHTDHNPFVVKIHIPD